jgi:hypothetical protein
MQPQREMSYAEKMELVQNLMTLPALTVMVCLRRNLGYRLLNPLHLLIMATVLCVIATFAQETPGSEWMPRFAAIMFIFGNGQRIRRWMDQRRGIRQHSYYIGDSIFAGKWLPAFLRRNRRFTRHFDPLACIIGGLCLLDASRGLAVWLVFSGLALRVLEDRVYRREQNQDLDTIDGMIASDVQAQAVEGFTAKPQARRQDDQGIATGLSADIEQQIKHRNKKTKASAK